MATKLTAEAAARVRCTCLLLQQVVDATWGPEEVLLPPHRRSIPLTYEQVLAQVPSPAPLSDEWSDSEDDDEQEHHAAVFGPALTRLTANQAINMLQDKPMICWVGAEQSLLTRHCTVDEKARKLGQITFSNLEVTWPPKSRCDWQEEDTFAFHGDYVPASAPNTKARKAFVYAANELVGEGLLVTTDTSCGPATDEEVWQFEESGASSDADEFDVFLCVGRDSSQLLVFLDPWWRRHTGRLKTAAPA